MDWSTQKLIHKVLLKPQQVHASYRKILLSQDQRPSLIGIAFLKSTNTMIDIKGKGVKGAEYGNI